jgi:NADPH:quinone reductase-like Zn-dependent oxidoreductase
MIQTRPNTMKAVALDRFGGIETLKPRTLPVPDIGPDEVLLHVESAGVGVWDSFEREGGFAEEFKVEPHFPYVLGSDGAGTIEAVGERVTRFKPGDSVYAFSFLSPKGGFYAEYVVVKEKDVSHIPGSLTVQQAGAMPVDAITALRGLDDTLHLKPNETVMIFGASGGIGHLAVQLAKRMGARVFAIASGDDGVELCERLLPGGVDVAVDGHNDDVVAAAREFAPDGIDAALLTAGGPAADQALSALRIGGRVAYPNGVEPEPTPPKGSNLKIEAYDGTPDREAMERLNGLIEMAGKIPGSGPGPGTSGGGGGALRPFEVHIARTYPLEQAADAQRELDKHYLGKLTLQTA